MNTVSENDNMFVFKCPHCSEYVQVEKMQVNCTIFRHAIRRDNYTQISPHTPKLECDYLVETNQVYGCAKPFKFVYASPVNYVIECDYI